MNAFLLDLWHDLRSTKLWPVAVGLLLALVALPVFLLKSQTTPPDPVVPAVSGTGAQAAAVSLLDPASARPSPLSAFSSKDPFSRPRKARSSSKDNAAGALAGSPASTGAAPGPGLAGGSGSGLAGTTSSGFGETGSPLSFGGGGGSGDGGPMGGKTDPTGGSDGPSSGGSPLSGTLKDPTATCSDFSNQADAQRAKNTRDADGNGRFCEALPCPCAGPSGTTPAPVKSYAYRVDVRFGATDQVRTIEGVKRLTPLPNDRRPYVIFLGVEEDGKTAVFLVNTDKVEPSGSEGECKPSPTDCSLLYLKDTPDEDQHSFLDQDGNRYGLTLTGINREAVASGATGAKAEGAKAATQEKPTKTERRNGFSFPDFFDLFRGRR